jgi:hypothetical protein
MISICYLQNRAGHMAFEEDSDVSHTVYGDVSVITRFDSGEIRGVTQVNKLMLTFHCHTEVKGVRDISIYFYNTDHRDIFDCTLAQYSPVGLSFFSFDWLSDYAIKERIYHATGSQRVPLGGPVEDFWKDGWDSTDWAADARFSRIIYPSFNEQMVWISKPSDGLRAWLNDHAQQYRFRTCDNVVPDVNSIYYTVMQSKAPMTPIESAIKSYLFGPGHLLHEDREGFEEEAGPRGSLANG